MPSVKAWVGVQAKPAAVLTCGVTTWLSTVSVALSGWMPEPSVGPVLSLAEGSDRLAEMSGRAVVTTHPAG